MHLDLDTATTAHIVSRLAAEGELLGEPGPSHAYSPETIGAGRVQFWPDMDDEERALDTGIFVLAVRGERTESNGVTWQFSQVAELGRGRRTVAGLIVDEVMSVEVAETLAGLGAGEFSGPWVNEDDEDDWDHEASRGFDESRGRMGGCGSD